MATDKYKAEPVTFAARRAQTVRELRMGKMGKAPTVPHRPQTDAQKLAEAAIVRKLFIRRARALAARCLVYMEGDTQLGTMLRKSIRQLRDTAKQSECSGAPSSCSLSPTDAPSLPGYQNAHMLNSKEPTPSNELNTFLNSYDAEMKRHARLARMRANEGEIDSDLEEAVNEPKADRS